MLCRASNLQHAVITDEEWYILIKVWTPSGSGKYMGFGLRIETGAESVSTVIAERRRQFKSIRNANEATKRCGIQTVEGYNNVCVALQQITVCQQGGNAQMISVGKKRMGRQTNQLVTPPAKLHRGCR